MILPFQVESKQFLAFQLKAALCYALLLHGAWPIGRTKLLLFKWISKGPADLLHYLVYIIWFWSRDWSVHLLKTAMTAYSSMWYLAVCSTALDRWRHKNRSMGEIDSLAFWPNSLCLTVDICPTRYPHFCKPNKTSSYLRSSSKEKLTSAQALMSSVDYVWNFLRFNHQNTECRSLTG